MLPTGTVTFLFTDIEGSTRLFQQAPSAMDSALVRHHEILREAIESHSGHVFQIIGDAFCAAFAGPIDAVSAALASQRVLRNESWVGIDELRVRMGIHTGEIRMLEETYASSLTLVTVQRVMSAGHGGQTLLADSTAALVREELPDGVALRDMGPHRLRGLTRPVPLFQLVATDLPAEFPTLKTVQIDSSEPGTLLELLRSGVLVGRTRELSEIRHQFKLSLESRGHLALLSGEPGVGKSRLAQTAMEDASRAGAVVLSGGCYEYEATTPYLPFVEAIRHWVHWQPAERLRETLGATAAELARFAPEIEAKLGKLEPNAALSSHDERLRLFDGVARFLEILSGPRGLLVVLDDVHWADDSTLSLLHYLLRHLRGSRVLFLGAYREMELDRRHPLAAALVEWNRERLVTRIPLGRLTRDDTAELLQQLFGHDTVSPEFTERLYAETEGNPFFVEESVKTLIEQGSIYRDGDRWERGELSELAIPQSVKEAIGRRLTRLDEGTTTILHTAAALGKQFDFRELAAIVADSEDEILDAIDEATAAQLLIAGPGERFQFTHDKIREVLYEELNPIRRRRLHQRIGECLINLDGETNGEYVQDIAHHFAQSGDLERSVEYSTRAADRAASVFAFDEAQHFLTQAIEAADALGQTAILEDLIERSGDVYVDQGRAPDAARRYSTVLEAHEAHKGERAGVLRSKLGRAYCDVGDARGLDHLSQALVELPVEAYPVDHSLVLTSIGRYHHFQGRPHEAIESLERALSIAERIGDYEATAYAYSYLSGAYQHLGDLSKSCAWANRLIELGESSGHPYAVATGNEFLAEAAFIADDFRGSLVHSDRNRAIADEIGALDRVAWSLFARTQALHGLGRLHEARSDALEGLQLCERIGEGRLATFVEPALSVLATEMGEYDTALVHARGGVGRSDSLGQVFLRVWALNAVGYRLLRIGEFSEAVTVYDECLHMTGESDARMMHGFALPNAVEALLANGEIDRARALVEDAEHRVSRPASTVRPGQLARLRGLVELASGNLEAADAPLQIAISSLEENGANLDLARTLLARARLNDERHRYEAAAADRLRGEQLLAECGAVPGAGIG